MEPLTVGRDGVFIAGTDTGIGKTFVSCQLLAALRQSGLRACGMKPVASGCESTPEGLRNEDALALQAASEEGLDYDLINPVAMAQPWSPHLAAEASGKLISMQPLRTAYEQLRERHDCVVVEGVGGWMVPLAPGLDASALALEWQLPVILVVGIRLGCINHALLTARAILADGGALLGWVANRVDPRMEALEANIQTLRERLPVPLLGDVGYAAAQGARGMFGAVRYIG
ncbi:dethiobiotin synthase [Frateuria aurantia]